MSSNDQPDDARTATIDRLMREGLIGTTAAARLLGKSKNDRPVHQATISRWAQEGIRTTGGRVVKLEHVRVGGHIRTSRAAILRFITAQQDEPATLATAKKPRRRGK